MEFNSNQINSKDALKAKIRDLEETKSHLQHDIAKIQETLANTILEKKAQGLEGEIDNLEKVKMRLQKKIKNNNLPRGKTSLNTTKETNAQKKPQSQHSPVRYGTWSKLPVS
tara:strand:+ start:430 stop:765 length:336 start_codon:yes stop_codon:yes gene_type:complete